MRKVVVVSIAVVVAVLAVPVLAAKHHTTRRTYFGPAANGVNNAGVEISARLTDGDPSKITKFEWHNVPMTCSRGRSATTDQLPKTIKVKNGAFHSAQKLSGGQTRVTVDGDFKHSNQRMAGTLRVRGTVPGCSSGDTGTVDWTAKQPAGQK